MNNKQVSIVLVGISGYGHTYLKEILLFTDNKNVTLSGVVDISPKKSKYYDQLVEKKIPVYHSLEEFYQNHQADLAIISTPIHLHKEHSCTAMMNGSHVLCEKPVAMDPSDIEVMQKTSQQTEKFVAVGFNWSFTSSFQSLKKDMLAGEFGKAIRCKSLTLWPRSKDYYGRSPWAGKKYSSQGKMIYDSVASNATAHYLHCLLYLMGDSMEKSAGLKHVTADLYKVNEIETFDTCAVRIQTQSNVELYYYASHAIQEAVNPQFELQFEKATIHYQSNGKTSDMLVRWHDGRMKSYENPNLQPMAKLDVCIEAIRRGDHHIYCGIEAATPHVEAIHMMHESVPHPPRFPSGITQFDPSSNLLFVKGLKADMKKCYDEWCLPSDLAFEWSRRGKCVTTS